MAKKKIQAPATNPKPRAPRAIKPPVVKAVATSCPVPTCGSTEREPYFNVRERAIAGVDQEGKPFTHVVWRRTRCKTCGQTRDDKTFENRPTTAKPSKRRTA